MGRRFLVRVDAIEVKYEPQPRIADYRARNVRQLTFFSSLLGYMNPHYLFRLWTDIVLLLMMRDRA